MRAVAEWDEFKALDFKKIYSTMTKPAFVFDGGYSACSLPRQLTVAWHTICFLRSLAS
jgi:hypothetical protein